MRGKLAQIELKPVDYAQLIPKLELTIGQLAKLSDLSIRQVSYWTEKGILEASNPKKRIYRAEALHRALLVKQCLDQGLTLSEAVALLRAYSPPAAAEAGPAAVPDRPAPPPEPPAPRRAPDVVPFGLARLGELRAIREEIRAAIPGLERLGDAEGLDLAHVKLEIIALFERNPYLRDTAPRIALQLGRDADLVRRALESLIADRARHAAGAPSQRERGAEAAARSVGGGQ